MNDSPIFRARQAALTHRVATVDAAPVQEVVAPKETKKAKKNDEPVSEPEIKIEAEVEVEAPKEIFPPVLENKAIQPEEVKEEIKEDEEML
jgi:hypothetical protein